MNEMTKTTEELENELKSITDSIQLEDWINANKDQKLDFGECLNHLLDEKGVMEKNVHQKRL